MIIINYDVVLALITQIL